MKINSAYIQERYNRLAPFYDGLEAVMEGLIFKGWRKKLWAKVDGYHILEVGTGTGKNFDYYPDNARVTAVDFSKAMLNQAARKKERKKTNVDLELMDIQSLSYADNSFDTVVATFVFCSVPLPAKGLRELYRVCKPGGQVLLLEHVISSKPFLARIMEKLNPYVLNLVGANINRNTVKNVRATGFKSVHVDKDSTDIIKLIEARK